MFAFAFKKETNTFQIHVTLEQAQSFLSDNYFYTAYDLVHLFPIINFYVEGYLFLIQYSFSRHQKTHT